MPPQTTRTRAHASAHAPSARARRGASPDRCAPAPAAAPPVRRGSTGVFERLRALPETRVVDGLLRGRAWIWLIGLLLGGIVAMQVSLLKLNAGISRAVTTAGTLERQNADLEAEIAKLSSERAGARTAARDGMVTPAAGAVEFLHARGRPRRAARRAADGSRRATSAAGDHGQRRPRARRPGRALPHRSRDRRPDAATRPSRPRAAGRPVDPTGPTATPTPPTPARRRRRPPTVAPPGVGACGSSSAASASCSPSSSRCC